MEPVLPALSGPDTDDVLELSRAAATRGKTCAYTTHHHDIVPVVRVNLMRRALTVTCNSEGQGAMSLTALGAAYPWKLS